MKTVNENVIENEIKPLMNLNGKYIFEDTKIEFVNKNPKRPSGKSHARFEKYMTAKTVSEALTLGATKADLKYDSEKKYLTII